jgi:DNA replication protein DnaC
MSDRSAELERMLHGLKLGTMARLFSETAVRASREGLTHEEFLYELACREAEAKDARRVERMLRESFLPREKNFDTLDVSRFPIGVRQQVAQLRKGAFLNDAVNVVAVGQPGTGKSHLAAAIGIELANQGRSVLWTPTFAIVQNLLAAKRELKLPKELARLNRFECLVLDDIGYVQQEREEMEVLFTLLSQRYESRSTIITTNLVFSEWNRIFKDPMTTQAAIDRVVHHSVILDLAGVESYRAKKAEEDQKKKPKTNTTTEIQ